MRKVFAKEVEAGRELDGMYASAPGQRQGRFKLRCPLSSTWLLILVSDGDDWEECKLAGQPWEHVSVSNVQRCPTWEEMAWVKDLFFEPEECVVQYHPPKSQHVNVADTCLHLWRPTWNAVVMPPVECV
jgi:hypothetical protein